LGETKITIDKNDFFINGKKVYSDLKNSKKESQGLLMNARFIQGIFDDKADPTRFERFGFGKWDADAQTDRLIAALPQWYHYGLRAFTVGIQGGGPCFTLDNKSIDNNPFGEDGLNFDPAYAERLDRLIKASDAIGMVVIVSILYGAQSRRIKDGKGIRNAVIRASRWLKDQSYSNVLIEVANEMDVNQFENHKIVYEAEGASALVDLAKYESGGIPVGCSPKGGSRYRELAEVSDYVILHGNECSRQSFYNMIQEVRTWCPDKPILCNEDSQAVSQLKVSEKTHTSWGYYNNLTKQEPPTDWSVQPGEDAFFVMRMAEMLGIPFERPVFKEQFFFHGFEKNITYGGKRWIRVAALYPELIDYIDFYKNDELVYSAFEETFAINHKGNWLFDGVNVSEGEKWKAVIYLRDGNIIEKTGEVTS
jgi:hypothetical protein